MKYPCPCCGFFTLEEPSGKYGICDVCFWEDDPVQLRDINFSGGANNVTLKEARENYKKFGACEKKFVSQSRKPNNDEIKQ